jgi:hypothetical protein
MNVSRENKYLIFVDAIDDAAMYHVNTLQSVTCAAEGVVIMKFAPGSVGSAGVDLVTLTMTADTEKAFMIALANEIAFGSSPYIVVGDDLTGDHLASVTQLAITLDT